MLASQVELSTAPKNRFSAYVYIYIYSYLLLWHAVFVYRDGFTYIPTYPPACLCLPVPAYLPTYPSIHLPACPSIHLSIYPSTHLSIYLSIYPSIHPPIHPCIHLPFNRPTYWSATPQSICPVSAYLWVSFASANDLGIEAGLEVWSIRRRGPVLWWTVRGYLTASR